MAGANTEARISQVSDKGGNLYRVQVGNYQDLLAAKQDVDRYKSRGFSDAFALAVEGK